MGRISRLGWTVGVIVCCVAASARGWDAAAQDDATPVASNAGPVESGASPVAAGGSAPEDYCVGVGGILQLRYPVWGTNLPEEERIATGPPRLFCEFSGTAEADPATSWIAVDLQSLYAETPTLAALAYLTLPTMPGDAALSIDAATAYCRYLGGSSEFGGATGAGGGWVTRDDAMPVNPLIACAFPDGSLIDSLGLAYRAMERTRGADLSTRFRYQPDDVPFVFVGR